MKLIIKAPAMGLIILLLAIVNPAFSEPMDVDLSDGPDFEAFHQTDKAIKEADGERNKKIVSEVSIKGLVTGNEFKQLPIAAQEAYVMGLVDGLFLASNIDGSTSKLNTLNSCIKEMTTQQLVAIYKKYLDAYPEYWHRSMIAVTPEILSKACSISSSNSSH